MNVLFVHNNFPAQYLHVAQALAGEADVNVAAVGSPTARPVKGVSLRKYTLTDVDVSATHPFARRFDMECRRAEQVLYALSSLRSSGFVPDVVLAHPGWGETLPLRTIFPGARIIVYCEFFYGVEGRDVGFDPEFPVTGADGHVALHLKNAATLLALSDCDGGVSPTAWQRSTFPEGFQSKIKVIHEGVDVDVIGPAADAVFRLPSGRVLTKSDEVVTYVSRNLEPLRGYHVFMRALPHILAERPNAEILIVGGHGTSYGAEPPTGQTWKSIYFDEVAPDLDQRRVHFTGRLGYQDYLQALQISSAHVYLTYPFVASWSLLEAMSAECLVIGSDTAPVREMINAENGVLVPFFDIDRLARKVVDALAHPRRYQGLRKQARQTVLERYDMARICMPKMLSYIRTNQVRHLPDKPVRLRVDKKRVLARASRTKTTEFTSL